MRHDLKISQLLLRMNSRDTDTHSTHCQLKGISDKLLVSWLHENIRKRDDEMQWCWKEMSKNKAILYSCCCWMMREKLRCKCIGCKIGREEYTGKFAVVKNNSLFPSMKKMRDEKRGGKWSSKVFSFFTVFLPSWFSYWKIVVCNSFFFKGEGDVGTNNKRNRERLHPVPASSLYQDNKRWRVRSQLRMGWRRQVNQRKRKRGMMLVMLLLLLIFYTRCVFVDSNTEILTDTPQSSWIYYKLFPQNIVRGWIKDLEAGGWSEPFPGNPLCL